MATHTHSQILSSATYHLSLLQKIETLQYAPSALNQQSKYLHDLEVELGKIKQEVQQLGEKTKKERKEHEELRDSTTRKLAAKLKGKAGIEKFEAKKEKEEREYVEALENEMRERGKQTMLETMIEDAKKVKLDLEEKSNRLDATKKELSNLYHQVFDGPTVEFPRDDVLERELASAQATYDRVQAMLNSHSQAVNLLTQADQMLAMSLKKIDQALGYSTWDLYDMMERDALSTAAVYAAKAEMLVNHARSTSADVQAVGPLRLHQRPVRSLLGDVFFDNIFSDIRVHHQIQNNRDELAAASQRLKAQLRAARQRAQLAGADLVEASEVLAECNKELERYRREVFLRITGSADPLSEDEGGVDRSDLTAPPPSYGETSNTTHVSSDPLIARSENPQAFSRSNGPSPMSTPSGPPPKFSRYAPPPGPPPSGPPPPRLGRMVSAPNSTASRSSMSTGRSRSMRMPEPSFPFTTTPVTSSAALTVPSPYNPRSRNESGSASSSSHRRSRSSVSSSRTTSGQSGLLLEPKVSGHRRSRSSVSSSSAPGSNPDQDKALPPAPHIESRFKQGPTVQLSPPLSPPPSILNINSTTITQAPAGRAGDSSNVSSRSPSPEVAIPAHWGSSEVLYFCKIPRVLMNIVENPFAAMMMG
ncbi:hypothetical protein F5890DRAFT_1553243 [Lentinula detonsa]|uniref:Uncharacterized protein n=1 Tax=Lentinula detonsa TaxID=2804962 RepID=A0AA38Q0U2_9AGAR|nr:hypothetical protein F5890DRAFT_1553243 [Lentinula detonsa]